MFTATAFSSQDIVRDGLVLWLDANDKTSYPGTGTVWRDLSLGSNTGTLTNGPTFNSNNGGSIVFDGVDDYVNFGNVLNFERTNPFSISIWLITPNTSITQIVISKWINNGYEIFFQNPGKIGWTLANTGGGGNQIRVDSLNNSITTNEIFNITTTYDGNSSTNGLLIYKNGQILPTTSIFNNLNSSILNSSNLRLGILGNNILPFSGKIFNTLIYNRTLTPQEILQNYNATKSRFGL
jgi:hypothetical protein